MNLVRKHNWYPTMVFIIDKETQHLLFGGSTYILEKNKIHLRLFYKLNVDREIEYDQLSIEL